MQLGFALEDVEQVLVPGADLHELLLRHESITVLVHLVEQFLGLPSVPALSAQHLVHGTNNPDT